MSFHERTDAPRQSEVPAPSEPTGPVAADSLAAESMQSGGDFAADNPLAAASKQKGGEASTWANTDTSGASTLPPAADAEARDGALNDSEGVKYPDEGTGTGTAAEAEAGNSHATSTSTTGSTSVESAPSYAAATSEPGEQKPAGSNITQDDSIGSDGAVNSSFTGEIGSKDDPGRLAEQDFQARGQESVVAAGVPGKPYLGTMEKGAGYDELDREAEA